MLMTFCNLCVLCTGTASLARLPILSLHTKRSIVSSLRQVAMSLKKCLWRESTLKDSAKYGVRLLLRDSITY